MLFASIWGIMHIILTLSFLVLGAYALILTIKALKIYIKNNS